MLAGCCQWWNENDRRIATLEFDRDRKSMGVIVSSRSGKKSLLVKVFFSYMVKLSMTCLRIPCCSNNILMLLMPYSMQAK